MEANAKYWNFVAKLAEENGYDMRYNGEMDCVSLLRNFETIHFERKNLDQSLAAANNWLVSISK